MQYTDFRYAFTIRKRGKHQAASLAFHFSFVKSIFNCAARIQGHFHTVVLPAVNWTLLCCNSSPTEYPQAAVYHLSAEVYGPLWLLGVGGFRVSEGICSHLLPHIVSQKSSRKIFQSGVDGRRRSLQKKCCTLQHRTVFSERRTSRLVLPMVNLCNKRYKCTLNASGGLLATKMTRCPVTQLTSSNDNNAEELRQKKSNAVLFIVIVQVSVVDWRLCVQFSNA